MDVHISTDVNTREYLRRACSSGAQRDEVDSAYALATRALARLRGATLQSSALRSCDTSRLMLPRIAATVRATSAESPKAPAAPIVTQPQAVILPTLSAWADKS
jgi:hypothetical protein